MKNLNSLFISLIVLCAVGLSDFGSTKAFAAGDVIIRNNNGMFAKVAADGKYYPAQLCFSTDGAQALVPCGKAPGGAGLLPIRLNTNGSSIGISVYSQLAASLTAAAHYISVYNGTSSELILATGTVGAPIAFMDVAANSLSPSMNVYLPAGVRLSAVAAQTTASSGVVIVNLLQ